MEKQAPKRRASLSFSSATHKSTLTDLAKGYAAATRATGTTGQKMVHGTNIWVGYDKQLEGIRPNTRSKVEYLNAHNWRRKKYHEQFGSE